MSNDKDIKGVVEELTPIADTIVLTKANLKRAEDPSLIRGFIKGKEVILTDSVKDALHKALSLLTSEDAILITGSFFVIGEVKNAKLSKEKITF